MNNAMMGQMMGMLGSVLPKPKPPSNEVAEFVRAQLERLPMDDRSILDMIEGVVVGMANENPNMVLKILINLHNDIGEFVTTLQEGQNGDPAAE